MPQYAAILDLPELDGADGFRLDGIDAFDLSGCSVASAGDVNGDGFDDILIGAYGGDRGALAYAGETYVIFGAASGWSAVLDLAALDGADGFTLIGIDAGDNSGRCVASAGDINGDGFDDVIIGAHRADPGGQNYAGESYVIFGAATGWAASLDLSTLDGVDGFILEGLEVGDFSGFSVAGAGDVNGDGVDDFIIAAPRAEPDGGEQIGTAYVVFGSESGWSASFDLAALDGADGFRVDGILGYEQAGFSVSSAGDVNGDGFDDLIVGAPYAARAYVVFGASSGWAADFNANSLDGSDGFQINGVDALDFTAHRVAGAGDVNADGFDDIIVGAHRADPNGDLQAGETYVVFGAGDGWSAAVDLANLDGTDGFRLDGVNAYDYSGFSAAGAGDFNGDGFADLLIGAYRADPHGDYSGVSYLVFGRANGFAAAIDLSALDGNDGLRIEGAIAGLHSGLAVASLGDVNGDGLSDIIIGARNADALAGESYVIFGARPGEAVTRTGTATANTIFGGAFNDSLSGLGGADVLDGFDGDDMLDGGCPLVQ